MEPVKVPQHLEIEDVLVWGLSATDLLWMAGGLLIAWWIVLSLPAPLPLQVTAASLAAIAGALLGPGRLAGRPLRVWVTDLIGFARRPRRRVYRGGD
ncbi:MAG: PrgI family protein [Candidatus Dormibacteraeota bacterium]|nr:PrgI family protein [Candidatus Dormibacteraeota bacterium]